MKKLLYPIAFTLTAFLILYSCSAEEDTTPPPSVVATPEPEPPAPTQFTLTVTAGEGGTVSNEGGTFDEGTEVTISATPAEGYEFAGWEGSDSDSDSLSITVNGNITVQALFAQLPVLILPPSPSKMFTKGVADTLSVGFTSFAGFKSVSLEANYGTVEVLEQPEEGANEGNIVVRYTPQSIENVDYDITIAGYDIILLQISLGDDTTESMDYKIRTQPEPKQFEYNVPSAISRNIKIPLDVPLIRWLNKKDNYKQKNDYKTGEEDLYGTNGESLNQFENSYGFDIIERTKFSDLNNDGYLDIVTKPGYIGSEGHGTVLSNIEFYLYENGEYKFLEISSRDLSFYTPSPFQIADFNLDGYPDILISSKMHDNEDIQTNTLLLVHNGDINNIAFEKFDLGYDSQFNAKAIFDLNGDGTLDFFQFIDSELDRSFFNNNSLGFTRFENRFLQVDGEINEFLLRAMNDVNITDLNNDGSPDLIVTGKQHYGKSGVFWGDTDGAPYLWAQGRYTEIPEVKDWGLILEQNIFDIDGDGLLEIILNRTTAKTAEGGEDFHMGWHFQVVETNQYFELFDVTDKYFEEYKSQRVNGVCQGENHYFFNMGLFDYDNDGNIEFFNSCDQGIVKHEWEWNGSKFIKISP